MPLLSVLDLTMAWGESGESGERKQPLWHRLPGCLLSATDKYPLLQN
jgi:hypothetical protein